MIGRRLVGVLVCLLLLQSLFALFPDPASALAVPLLSQRDSRWSSNILGYNDPNARDSAGHPYSIYWYGCFITSLSMLFNYYQAGYTDPGRLNEALKANNGYEPGTGYLRWNATNSVAPSGVSYAGADTNWSRADQELAAGRPVLADVRSSATSQHMVVIVAKNGGSYALNDPWTGQGYTWPNGALSGTGGYSLTTFRYYSGGSGGGTQPGIPTLQSPQDGYSTQANQTINFSWSNTGATQYKFEAWNTTGSGSQSPIVGGTSYSFAPGDAGTWKWQVRSMLSNGVPGDAPPTRSFTVTSVPPPPPPTPCNPNADQVVLYVDAGFSGQCVVKGIGDYPNPGAIGLPNDSVTSIKVGSSVQARLCRDDNYQGLCDVFLADNADLSYTNFGSDQVSSMKVEVRSQPPSVPTPQSPADGATFTEGASITVSWSGNGDEYFGEIWRDGALASWGWQPATSAPMGTLAAGYTYYWHVKARNGAGESGWSTTRSFYVVPAAPSGLSGQVISCSQISLSWTDNSSAEDRFDVSQDGQYLGSSGSVGANVTSITLQVGTNATHAYTVTASRGIYPSAASNSISLTTPSCPTTKTLSLSASPLAGGTATASPSGPTYAAGTVVTLAATPNSGYTFSGWTVDGSPGGTTNPRTITMDGNHTVVANFSATPSLSNDTFPGTVVGTLPAQFTVNTSTATTQSGEPAPPCTSTPSGKTVWYTFTPQASTRLTIATAGSSFDTILAVYTGTAVNALTPVPNACNDDYGDGMNSRQSQVTFMAAAGTPYRVQAGGYNGDSGNLAITFSVAPPATYMMPLSATPGGTASASPTGPSYTAGTIVTLTATANSGYTFTGWTIDNRPAGMTNPLTLTVNANQAVEATFAVVPPATYTLNLAATPGGGGSVSATPPNGPYTAGTSVTLTATATSGYTFSGWTVDGAPAGSTNPYTLTMNANHAIVANFAANPPAPPVPPVLPPSPPPPGPTTPPSAPTWSTWASQGGILTDSPAAAEFNGRVYVFAKGSDNALYVKSSADGASWTGWQRLGGELSAAPAAASVNGRLYAFVRWRDNTLYVISTTDGQSYSPWTTQGGILTAPPAAAGVNGVLYVFAKGSDNALYLKRSTDGISFSAWQNLGGILTAAPAAAGFQGQVYVFAKGSDNALYEKHAADGVNFTNWSNYGGILTAAPAAASYTPRGGSEVLYTFAKGTDNALYERHTTDGMNWTGWVSLGGQLVGPPAAAGVNGQLYAFVWWRDNALWERHLQP